MPDTAPTATGRSIVLDAHGVRAEIGTVAAVLRSLTVAGTALTEPISAAAPPPLGCGIVLVPWPNRVRDARWTLDGAPQHLDITEPARGNAIHGLLRNTEYSVRERAGDSVTLAALIPPQHGWPFLLDTTVGYTLRTDGLTVVHTATNHGDRPAPWAVGAHPYLRVGDTPVGELVLTVHADTWFDVDERMNPTGEHPVDGTDRDLRDGVRVDALDLDTAFGAVTPRDGVAARLTATGGATVDLRYGADWGYLQVFTPRTFPRPDGPGLAIAVEPMTAPPDALNSGRGLHWLEPGETTSRTWEIVHTPGR
ncbi:aldose 1-epimerase family protein [Nocardia farcinica]|uniref:aldose 1-epimerase family protein n=1 Tax=Nocardia farcinica TaxID=37329 RepID=UPI0027D9E56D|nr:aldose 1-epimerase family protein [Nocardia farcinica]MBF6536573.1 aldose 1-epimerase family protein [Nocardia farcinica]